MTQTTFDAFKITNGHVKWDGETESTELGCTGKLEIETELKTVTKKCEGEEVFNMDIPVKQTGTLSLHMPVEIARKAFGLSSDGLKTGVFAYGTNSRPGRGCLTFDVHDIYGTVKKMIAIPNASVSGGMKSIYENGLEEIAEVELSLQSLKDTGGKFYYEAFESEVEDAGVKEQWHMNFSHELVKFVEVTVENTTSTKGVGK